MTVDVVRQKGYVALGSRLIRIGEALRAETQKLLNSEGLPIQSHHYPLLAALHENGPMSIGALAETLGVSQPGVTRTVSKLTGQGILAESRDERDRRVRLVELSDTGKAIVQEGIQHLWPHMERCLSDIMGDKRDDLLSLLDHLEDAVGHGSVFVGNKGSADE